MTKIFKNIHYRNSILRKQNQMSGGHLVEIAACGCNQKHNRNDD